MKFLPNECDFEILLNIALEQREVMEAEDMGCWSKLFELNPPQHDGLGVRLWNGPTGIYKVFYLLIDGVTCCLTQMQDPVQKTIGEVIMTSLNLLIDVRGAYLKKNC